MDLLKISLEWAKDEIFSARFFILFGFFFVCASFGFWQLGKQELAKAFIYPLLVCGSLLMIIGIGLTYSNTVRLNSFGKAYDADAQAFTATEIERVDKTMAEFELIVFKVIPFIIIFCALIFVVFDQSLSRGICLSIIGMMVVIMLVDTHSYMRLKEYKKHLVLFQDAPK